MINLLYHSHTVVPAHLEELETLRLLERDEQVLVALDGVLLNAAGHRLSGPTLHDYCLVTTLRVLLWARDYSGHTCYAFPLTELELVQGAGLDPLHAQISLTFTASEDDEEEQSFTLTLLPVANLQAALKLIRSAAETARELAATGVDAREAGPEILSVLGEQIYGHVDGLRPGEKPYRWPGAPAQPLTPVPGFYQDVVSLPPEKIYSASRLARSAWDTLRRSLREAELPFDLNGSSLRDLTEAVRAINDLVHTVATNPSAQQMAMAFLNNRQGSRSAPAAPEGPAAAAPPPPQPAAADAAGVYHEIPLRRRENQASASPKPPTAPPMAAAAPPTEPPDRREIPLRRRGPASSGPRPFSRTPIPISGSGDADVDDGR
ncbi:hypothetical protein EKD04_022100 [Chloroflexales bacterium ZM16-3]|nr:hypothetical protein [Chloroflexales bacterium ZM16-3]